MSDLKRIENSKCLNKRSPEIENWTPILRKEITMQELSNQELFREIVFCLEDAIVRPYTKICPIKNYGDLAFVLNAKGKRNSRGQELNKKSISKCINRIENKNDYIPEILEPNNFLLKHLNIQRIQRGEHYVQ